MDYTTGVYDVADLYESGLRNNGNSTTGFRIKGLTPGTYEVSLVPMFRNAQAAGAKADAAVTFSIGLGNDTDARNTGDFTLTSTVASPTQNIDTTLTSWTASTDGSTAYNYIGATVTIDSTARWLTFLLGDSTTPGPDRPGPCVIQLRLTSTSVDLSGDFNESGKVDAADYTVWRDNLGSPNALPNDDTAGVGPDDYDRWKANFGHTFGAGTSAIADASVPEPATVVLLTLAAVGCCLGPGRAALRSQQLINA